MPLLDVRSLTVRFGGHIAVDHVDLTAEAGVVTGLIGPNGAGKTTVFNAITGLQEISGGRIVLDGLDLTEVKPHRRARAGIARTFQRLEIFGSLTVRENLLVAAEIRRRWSGDGAAVPESDVESVLDLVGIRHISAVIAESLPTGLSRLVELGRALATRPKLLLLDEPASGLDETETEQLAELLLRLAGEGMAILLVEHDVPLVMQVCSLIHVLDHGALLAVGTAEEIQADPKVHEAYLGATVEEPVPVGVRR